MIYVIISFIKKGDLDSCLSVRLADFALFVDVQCFSVSLCLGA